MSKLGISKTKLLSDPQIAMLYDEFKQRQAGSGKRKMKGTGLWDGFVKFLKDSKILSKVGDVLLPLGGAALGGVFTSNPAGAASGAALGSAGAEWIRSQGFGHMKGHGHCCMHGGASSTLSINPPGQRLGQRGGARTLAYNGTFQQVPGTQRGFGRIKGMGGTEYGSVSSEFGKIRV